MARPSTKRLDDTLRLLRKPKAQPLADRRPVYAAGLRALNWYEIPVHLHGSQAPYWMFTKDGKQMRIFPGDRIELAMTPHHPFKPLPQKARRNIALAGQ